MNSTAKEQKGGRVTFIGSKKTKCWLVNSLAGRGVQARTSECEPAAPGEKVNTSLG